LRAPAPRPLPATELERLTIDAAVRLIRARLRQHLQGKALAIDRLRGRPTIYDLVMDGEKCWEAASQAALWQALRLWTNRDFDNPPRWVRACLKVALTRALERTVDYAAQSLAEHPREDVAGWVREFVVGFDLDGLVHSSRFV
jgi:hypothetical protein